MLTNWFIELIHFNNFLQANAPLPLSPKHQKWRVQWWPKILYWPKHFENLLLSSEPKNKHGPKKKLLGSFIAGLQNVVIYGQEKSNITEITQM